jgi:integrase
VRPAAGLDDLHVHDLRHAAASALLAAGMHAHEVASLLGHRDGGRLVETLHGRALDERLACAGDLMDAWMDHGAGSTG